MMEGWKEYKLKELLEIKYGKDHKHLKGGKYPLYGSGGIMRFVDNFLFEGESILIPRKGTLTNLFFLSSPFWTVDTMFWSRIEQNKVLPKFLYYRLKTYDFSTLDVGTAIPSLTTKVLYEVLVQIPKSKETQRKIAKILSAYDHLIENNLKRIKLLEKMAQKTYEEWFVRFKFPGYETAVFDEENGLPEGWKKSKIGQIIDFVSGYAFKSKDFKDNGNSVIKIKNIANNTIDIFNTDYVDNSVEVPTKFKLTEGDLLIAMTGATIGKVGFIPKNDKIIYLNQRVGKLQQKGKINNVAFVSCLFNSQIGLQQILNFASGAAQPNISGNDILSIKSIIPKNDLLDKFSKTITPMIAISLKLYYQNQHLKKARDILLPRLMAGMIDV